MNFNNKFNNRVQDTTQIFERRYNAKQNKANEPVASRKGHLNKMFNIKPKEDQRKELRYQNSVEGQVKALNERMNVQNQANRINRTNSFRNGFK